jgi:hypothetical protein
MIRKVPISVRHGRHRTAARGYAGALRVTCPTTESPICFLARRRPQPFSAASAEDSYAVLTASAGPVGHPHMHGPSLALIFV